ncbi:MAG: flagellar biosynthesis protein FlgN [Nocardioides sp.]|nr:flagellar biosynthesis protein FlgN [Nocardioides sp.]
MEKLGQVLWQERELLDTLHYRLEVEQLVLASGRSHHLMRAARDVDAVLTTLRETEVLRAVAADAAAEELGLAPSPSLRELAEASPEPWRTILDEHRQAFSRVTEQISAMADTNRELLTQGYRSAREALASLGEPATESYRPDGRVVTAAARRLLDQSL